MDTPTTSNTSIIPVTSADDNLPLTSEERPNKRRRKKSIVWEHFTIENVGAGCMRALCKQCKKSFAYITGSKLAGTSHLKRHIALGICPVSRQKNEASSYNTLGTKSDPPKRRYRSSSGYSSIPFDQDRCSHELAKMIILHGYPLHIVEHPAFIDFVRTLQPQYNMVSFNTIEGECVAMYLREKQNLLNCLSGIPGRVSLTLDLATSNMNIGYAFLIGHFIDANWNLQHRILNVVMLPFPDWDYAFNQAVVSCLSDWQLEGKLFTLTLDQSFSNETIMGNLRGLLSVRNPLLFNGQLLKGKCFTRVLGRLAQDALGAMGHAVRKIRESVIYVKTSEAHDEKFGELRQQLQVPSTKELIIDDQTRWNTTYQMLVTACELKEVFACLDTSDPVYKINPSIEDWKQVEILCKYLKLLFDAANLLTGTMCPPANLFYHEVSKVQLELTNAAMSQDPFVSNLTKPLKEKLDQYWKECFLVLAIAVVMDPRFKMKLVEFSFARIFGEDAGMWIKMVDDGIHELFLEYLMPTLSLPSASLVGQDVDNPQSETPHDMIEVPPENGPRQEVLTGAPQEVPNEEITIQEAQPQEVILKERQSQEVTLQEAQLQQVPAEEMNHQEAPPPAVQHEKVPSQDDEMHKQEGSPQEIHTEVMAEKVQPQVNSEDSQPREAEPQEPSLPPQESHTEEFPQTMETHESQSQETDTQEVLLQMDTEEVPSQDIHAEEVPSQAMHIEEVWPEEMRAEEALAHDFHTEELPTEMMQSAEAPAKEMHSAGVLPQDMHTQEIPSQEIDPQEMQPQDLPIITIGDGLSDFDMYMSAITSGQHMKSELEQYLEESLMPRVQEFDILGWWKLNQQKYPALSKMAADILSIPVSTVAPESVFDLENKKIDNYGSSLHPVTLEALICAKDWLQQHGSSSAFSTSVEAWRL